MHWFDDTSEVLANLGTLQEGVTHDELWADYKTSPTSENRNRLVEFHIPLVIKLAKKHQRKTAYPKSLLFGDFVSWGTLGLIYAIERFDDSKGFQLSTYAYHCIKGYIFNGINNFGGRTHRETCTAYFHRKMISLDSINYKAGCRPDLDLLDRLEAFEIKQIFMQDLNTQERLILEMRYDMDFTYREIAKHIGVSLERVRQLLLRIENKVRDRVLHFVERGLR